MMSESVPPDQTPQVVNASDRNAENTTGGEPVSTNGGTRRHTWFNNRHGNVTRSTPRDFVDNTPKLGGILGLCSENVAKNNYYYLLCEKLGTHIMTEFKNGDAVIQVTKEHNVDVMNIF